MGYFIITIFSTFMGSPPKFLPVAFKSKVDCEYHLTKSVKYKHKEFNVVINEDAKYLVNSLNNKFIICKKLEYPINKKNLLKTKISF